MSEGWQSNSRHKASSVKMRRALTLPVLRIDILDGVMPIRVASSPELIFRRASITSMLIIIGMITSPS